MKLHSFGDSNDLLSELSPGNRLCHQFDHEIAFHTAGNAAPTLDEIQQRISEEKEILLTLQRQREENQQQ